MSRVSPTAEFASVVYGDAGVALDDAAEAFHESSRLYPRVAPPRVTALRALARNAELQQTVARSSRTHAHRPGILLERNLLPDTPLREVLVRRRSRAPAGAAELPLRDLGTLLEASYTASGGRRFVPSGGALYPLELYVLALTVGDCTPSVFHHDPFAHRLELLAPLEAGEAAGTVVDPLLVQHAAAVLVVTGMFWRSRFKYGARGYRFALLEAGHVVQTVLLAATALEIAALPVGGFYDRRVDALVGADGLDESSLYLVVLGGRP